MDKSSQVNESQELPGEPTEPPRPAQESRYFTHASDRFGDSTAYLRCDPDGVVLVLTDGTEHRQNNSGWNLELCENVVSKGYWKEITKAEAKALITHDAPEREAEITTDK